MLGIVINPRKAQAINSDGLFSGIENKGENVVRSFICRLHYGHVSSYHYTISSVESLRLACRRRFKRRPG